MAYDEQLAARIRAAVDGEDGLTEQRMFGGLGFMVHGNMAVAASSEGGLLLRIDPADADSLTRDDQVRRMEMRGREMNGWLRVDPPALVSEEQLQHWVDIGLTYARSLPPK
jgi:TfoX/Sxy family transcriptional regulator of competence genes